MSYKKINCHFQHPSKQNSQNGAIRELHKFYLRQACKDRRDAKLDAMYHSLNYPPQPSS